MNRSICNWLAAGLLTTFAASVHAVTTSPQLGDVDGDGQVTIRDAVLVLRKSVGISPINGNDLLVGDISPLKGIGKRPIGDGALTPKDAIAVMSIALNQDISFQSTNPMTVSTVAGSSIGGFDNGLGRVKFQSPSGVAVDASGNIYVADRNNRLIRKVQADGTTLTLAGSGSVGLADGQGTAAQFTQPLSIAESPTGDIFVMDSNHLRRISPDGTVITVFPAGSGTATTGTTGTGTTGTGTTGTTTTTNPNTTTAFSDARGIAVDSLGYVYVADGGSNPRIWQVSPSGQVVAMISQGLLVDPTSVAVDGNGFLYVVDSGANRITRINPDGSTIVLAGSNVRGNQDGIGLAAQFNTPQAITIDNNGTLYISDVGNHTIRTILQNGQVTTVAGSKLGFADGLALNAEIGEVRGLTVDGSGNVYMADETNNRIRRLTTQ